MMMRSIKEWIAPAVVMAILPFLCLAVWEMSRTISTIQNVSDQNQTSVSSMMVSITHIKATYVTQHHFYHNTDMAWAAIDAIRKSITALDKITSANEQAIDDIHRYKHWASSEQ